MMIDLTVSTVMISWWCIEFVLVFPLSYRATYAMETSLLWKLVQTTAKGSSKFIKKITHVDDMMIHNIVQYHVQTRFRLWDIKVTNFICNKLFGQLSGLKFVIFISYKRSRVWRRYFTKLRIIISSTCVIFLVNLDDFFIMVCTGFHENCGLH